MNKTKTVLTVIFFLFLTGFIFLMTLIFTREFGSGKTENSVTKKTFVTCPAGFKWGVGIAPFSLDEKPSDTGKNYKVIIDSAKNLGVNYVKIGVPDWGINDLDKLMGPIVDYADQKGLGVILGFDPPEGNPTKVEGKDIYADGYKWGEKMAKTFSGRVCYYQISNELSGQAVKPNSSGLEFSMFDDIKYKKVENWVRGASDALHKFDPKAKRLLTGHWVGAAIFEQLSQDKVSYDALGWDWFQKNTDLDNLGDEKEPVKLTTRLSKLGKELIIAEAGAPDGTKTSEADHADYITSFAKKIRSDSRYSGFFAFMMNDGVSSVSEGLAKPRKDGDNWVLDPKPVFEAYQKVIKENP